ncbi:hypothetical protein EON65_15240 [archaeon]|nr:MAG: hypothetical protein EON65_15240 [archaeon]
MQLTIFSIHILTPSPPPFSRYILYSVFVEGYSAFGCEWEGCYFFAGLLSMLQCLHIFWFYLIARMIYR